jgi:hypothetical protein
VKRTVYWKTIAVTPLPPGWRNVFAGDDGTPEAHPCPAVLLQENCGTFVAQEGKRTVFGAAEPPFGTRVVFADRDGGYLCPAVESDGFIGVIGPGQAPEDCDGT